jgi:hypothetical protein
MKNLLVELSEKPAEKEKVKIRNKRNKVTFSLRNK